VRCSGSVGRATIGTGACRGRETATFEGVDRTLFRVRAAPAEAETALRDRLQQLALAHRHYGYRRLGPLLRHEGWAVNHKRVLRLMREDNLLCLRRKSFVPATTDSRHGWRVWPNLARQLVPTAIDQLPRASC